MHIITVSRQFGSGGRELGKRLSDVLGYDYYDKEIIEQLSQEHNLDSDYVNHVLGTHGWQNIQLTYKSSFSHIQFDPGLRTELLVRQREIITKIAETGNDCIIVGRDADVILQDYHPFRIFVCADLSQRLERCMRFEEKKDPSDRLSEKEVRKNIRRIDKNRMRTREILTGKSRDDFSSFDMVINTGHCDIRSLSRSCARFALSWFEATT